MIWVKIEVKYKESADRIIRYASPIKGLHQRRVKRKV